METVLQPPPTADEVYEWLHAEAERQGLDATLYTHAARQENRFLIVPVHLAGEADAFDFAEKLQELEDAWNNQEPRPYRLLILRPAAKPRESNSNGHQ